MTIQSNNKELIKSLRYLFDIATEKIFNLYFLDAERPKEFTVELMDKVKEDLYESLINEDDHGIIDQIFGLEAKVSKD